MTDDIKPQHDDEIDLFELFQTVWEGKWTILSIVAIALVGALGFQVLQPPPTFTATTEIKPINSADAEQYRSSNAVGFFEVTPSLLQRLYIEQLEERILFEDAIRKFELLSRDEFDSEIDFNQAVTKLTSSIAIIPPANLEESNETARAWEIQFEFNDTDKWLDALAEADESAKDSAKAILEQRFKNLVSVAKQERQFKLEDIQTRIVNAKADYETEKLNRLAFLQEQAAIARELEVAENTLEIQTFNSRNGLIASVQADLPFYLRGYAAIEKEIELIEAREDSHFFVENLLELEQEKRRFEQDKMIERAESFFATTPVVSDNNFTAVSVNINGTVFDYQNKRMLMLALAILLGGMIGMIYVLIAKAIKNRQEKLS